MDSIFKANKLCTGYTYNKENIEIHSNLNFQVNKGQFIALVGPNGSGKSTLLKTLSKFLKPISGSLFINNKDINEIDIQDLSKILAIVITDPIINQEFKVIELIETARFPYSNFFTKYKENDHKIIQSSIDVVGLSGFENRKLNTLSDGELQRVMIARALCQQTDIILLDEPTSHLDVENRFAIISLLKRIAHTENKTIIFSTHELDLAIQTADIFWLFDSYRNFFSGTPEDLIIGGHLNSLFDHSKLEFQKTSGRFLYKHEYYLNINLHSDKDEIKFWTVNALNRIGINVTSSIEQLKIVVNSEEFIWSIYKDDVHLLDCNSLESLLTQCKTFINKPLNSISE